MKLKEMILWSDYGLLLYIFLGIAGIAIFAYFLVASPAINIVLSIISSLASIPREKLNNQVVSIAAIGLPVLVAILTSIPKRRYGAAILKYFAFILNFSAFMFYLSIPLAGIALLDYSNNSFRLASINELIMSATVIGVSAVMLLVIGKIQSSLPWIIVRIGFKEGAKVVGTLNSIPKDGVIEVPEGKSLTVTIYSFPERLKEVGVVANPRTDWRVSKTESEDKVSFDLTPVTDTNSEVSIIVGGGAVRKFKVVARALLRFATLTVELVRGGKVVRIIEAEHPVGTPLIHTLKKIAKVIPGVGDLSKYVAYLESGGNYRKIGLNYSSFSPGKRYHILLQPAGTAPTTEPVKVTREWTAKPIRLTREWAAKEVVAGEAADVARSAHEVRMPGREAGSDVEVVERLKLILEQIRSLGDDLW